jgi:hypothetical protein
MRQSSGALQEDEMSARFLHELLCANDNMNCYIAYPPICALYFSGDSSAFSSAGLLNLIL